MKEDDIEKVCVVIQEHLSKKRNLNINKGTLCIIYRSTTGNYSATSFREFIITLKSLKILNERKQGHFVFIPERLEDYKKLKSELD